MSDRHDEDEYFHKRDQEAIARIRAQLQAKGMADDAVARRAAHANKCGRCGGDFRGQPFHGLEIDVCTSCGAVLLDPGELQKLAPDDHGSFVGNFLGAFGLKR